MTDSLLCSVDDGVALLTFNRPDAANTWSVDLHVAYLQALRDLAVDDDVRAVVLTGAGRHFCAGADVSLLDSIQNGGELPAELSSESFLEPIDFPKPLIAAVNGAAAGLGFIHALLCDVRFASEKAFFTTSFVQRGLVAEHGVSWLLPQIVGRGHALDMLLSSRRVGAEEAAAMGLVHRVAAADEVVAQAVAYARDLAANTSPAAMQVVKQQVTRHSTWQLMEAEDETVPLVAASLQGVDFKEGVRSFIERRPAQFAPLEQGRFATLPPAQPAQPGGPEGGVVGGEVDVAAVADRFFAATSSNDWAAAVGLLSPDAVLATYPGPPPGGVDGLAEAWQKLRDAMGPWEYTDVRRIVQGNTFCEQHLVRFSDLDVEIEVCCVATLDLAGRIVRLEEYADGHALRAAAKRRREEMVELQR